MKKILLLIVAFSALLASGAFTYQVISLKSNANAHANASRGCADKIPEQYYSQGSSYYLPFDRCMASKGFSSNNH